jgi:hypothetical protein
MSLTPVNLAQEIGGFAGIQIVTQGNLDILIPRMSDGVGYAKRGNRNDTSTQNEQDGRARIEFAFS